MPCEAYRGMGVKTADEEQGHNHFWTVLIRVGPSCSWREESGGKGRESDERLCSR